MIFLCGLLAFVFFAGVAMTINEGLWSNLVSLLSVLVSGVAGLFFGLPAGMFALEKSGQAGSYDWAFWFGGVWLTFFLVQMVLRTLTDRVSPVRLRFIPQLDKAFGILLGLCVAGLFTSILAFTLLKFPIAAGQWKLSEAAEWQKTWMQRAATPFNSVAVRIEKAEGVDFGLQ